MKTTIAFLSILIGLQFSACTSNQSGQRKVVLQNCVPGDSGKVVHLKANSFEDGGRVVRLVHR